MIFYPADVVVTESNITRFAASSASGVFPAPLRITGIFQVLVASSSKDEIIFLHAIETVALVFRNKVTRHMNRDWRPYCWSHRSGWSDWSRYTSRASERGQFHSFTNVEQLLCKHLKELGVFNSRVHVRIDNERVGYGHVYQAPEETVIPAVRQHS